MSRVGVSGFLVRRANILVGEVDSSSLKFRILGGGPHAQTHFTIY